MNKLKVKARIAYNLFKIWLLKLAMKHCYEEETKPEKRKSPKTEKSDVFGQYRSISELLDNLDGVFSDIRMIRGQNPVYQYIRKFGAFVVGDSQGGTIYEKELEFSYYGFPSNLCIYFKNERNENDFMNLFINLTKEHKIPYIGRSKNAVYYLATLTYICDGKPYSYQAGVQVDKDTHEIQALPHLDTRYTVLPSGKAIPHRGWRYPDLKDGLEDEKARKEYIESLFRVTYNAVMSREFAINIVARKGKHRATFILQHDEWKKFFNDRVDVIVNGKKKRIFHSVTSHYRNTRSGTVPVKTHYRGLRQFKWNGYDINIIIPGKHGVSQASFGAEAYSEMDDVLPVDYVDLKDAAGMITDLEEGRAQ